MKNRVTSDPVPGIGLRLREAWSLESGFVILTFDGGGLLASHQPGLGPYKKDLKWASNRLKEVRND